MTTAICRSVCSFPIVSLAILLFSITCIDAFGVERIALSASGQQNLDRIIQRRTQKQFVGFALSSSSTSNNADDDDIDVEDGGPTTTTDNAETKSGGSSLLMECMAIDETTRRRDRLKRELFQLAASYDRGFGASSAARDKAATVIRDLETYNQEKNAANGIDGTYEVDINENLEDKDAAPLKGTWRMIWTTAADVLLLQASPLLITGAVHQVIDPPLIINVIDWIPRAEILLPPNVIPSSLFRARVQTRASKRPTKPNRVGLVFESVQLQPMQILGMQFDIFPPLGFDLPKLPVSNEQLAKLFSNADGNADGAPGYFDVSYLDGELLIIRQNDPGGLFVLVKVDSLDS